MINFLLKLKPWQIIALGVTAVVVALVATTFVAQLCYFLFPAAWGFVAAGHVILAGAAAWFAPAPFIEAYQLQQADVALAHIIELLSEAFPEGHEVEPESNRG